MGVSDFKWRHFESVVILWAVRWYCKYGISGLSSIWTVDALVQVDQRLTRLRDLLQPAVANMNPPPRLTA